MLSLKPLEKIPQLAKRLWKEGELADEDFVRAGITRAEDEIQGPPCNLQEEELPADLQGTRHSWAPEGGARVAEENWSGGKESKSSRKKKTKEGCPGGGIG